MDTPANDRPETTAEQDSWVEVAEFMRLHVRMRAQGCLGMLNAPDFHGLIHLALHVQYFEEQCRTFDARIEGVRQKCLAYSDGYE